MSPAKLFQEESHDTPLFVVTNQDKGMSRGINSYQ